MKNLNFDKKKYIYFIGIGGISMSGLAKLVLASGYMVKGSDSGKSQELDNLESLGVDIYHTHTAENITNDVQLVVYSGAIKEDNPEICKARELYIPVMERSEFLGLVAEGYDKVIAIAGTHGKTTTTAILSEIFVTAGLNPTIHLGGESIALGGNTIIGGGEFFIVEACEYRESFKYLKPYIGVVTNIELDHVDYYSDYDAIHSAFSRFADNSKTIVSHKDANLYHMNNHTISDDWEVRNIEAIGGGYNFNVYYKGEYFDSFRLNTFGLHNVTNALFAIAVASICGIDKGIIRDSISGFIGVGRRYEKIADIGGCNVIIDYAHHPTELKTSIEGISAVYGRILYIFQPHTYTRTLGLFEDFVEVLTSLKDIVLFKTYPAREKIIAGGTAMDLYSAIDNSNKYYYEDALELIEFMCDKRDDFDCILVLGAGDLALNLQERLLEFGFGTKQ